MRTRRAMLGVLGGGAAVAAVAALRRTNVPHVTRGACPGLAGRRIRWIVPNAAGGGYDAESRLLEPLLERRLDAEIVVDNVPGAGGITGARALHAAAADGLTLGLIGVPGLLVAALTGATGAPDPTDFTVLGRVSRSWHVWATGRDAPFATLADAVAVAANRPLVFAINEVGSANFVSISVAAALLGVQVEMLPGFSGTRNATLAAMRGDADLVCFNFETIRDLIEAGDLRPVLQVSDRAVEPHPSLRQVPLLGGDDGEAIRHARASGADLAQSRTLASGLIGVMSAGRAIVAPPAVEPALTSCLGRGVADVLQSDALQAAAGRPLDTAPADRARDDMVAAARGAHALLPIVQRALQAFQR